MDVPSAQGHIAAGAQIDVHACSLARRFGSSAASTSAEGSGSFFARKARSAIGCAHVRFAPGARTAWHRHPKGQTLYVTDGIGLVATRWGGVQEIRPGDVVYIEPVEEHWHGATSDRYMAHVAMQEADENGSSGGV